MLSFSVTVTGTTTWQDGPHLLFRHRNVTHSRTFFDMEVSSRSLPKGELGGCRRDERGAPAPLDPFFDALRPTGTSQEALPYP